MHVCAAVPSDCGVADMPLRSIYDGAGDRAHGRIEQLACYQRRIARLAEAHREIKAFRDHVAQPVAREQFQFEFRMRVKKRFESRPEQ